MADQETMLVRLQGGKVERRPVAIKEHADLIAGGQILWSQEPELNDGEMVVRTLADPVPLIVKAWKP